MSREILRNAIKMFHDCRDAGFSVDEAAEKCYEHYPRIRVVPYSQWKPTKGNDSARRGPTTKPWKMTKKRGRKRKMTPAMVQDAKQLLKRNPKMNNASIAQHLNWYWPPITLLSESFFLFVSAPSQRRRGRKRRRTRADFYDLRDDVCTSPPPKKRRSKPITPENVSKALNRGIRRSSKNKSGSFQGCLVFLCIALAFAFVFFFRMGARASTKKGLEKRCKNSVPEHGKAFIEGKKRIYANDKKFLKQIVWDAGENPRFKKRNEIHIDTSKQKGDVWNVNTGRALAGTPAVQRRTQEKRIPGGSAFNGIWPGIRFLLERIAERTEKFY